MGICPTKSKSKDSHKNKPKKNMLPSMFRKNQNEKFKKSQENKENKNIIDEEMNDRINPEKSESRHDLGNSDEDNYNNDNLEKLSSQRSYKNYERGFSYGRRPPQDWEDRDRGFSFNDRPPTDPFDNYNLMLNENRSRGINNGINMKSDLDWVNNYTKGEILNESISKTIYKCLHSMTGRTIAVKSLKVQFHPSKNKIRSQKIKLTMKRL